MNVDSKVFIFLGGIAIGTLTAAIALSGMGRIKVKEDDECKSLFYSVATGANGAGHPNTNEGVTTEEIQTMKTVQKGYVKLPFEMYKQAVQNLPICCVDIICQRKTDNKMLLFYRRDKPAPGIQSI